MRKTINNLNNANYKYLIDFIIRKTINKVRGHCNTRLFLVEWFMTPFICVFICVYIICFTFP
jgi:hypothetical protein